MVQLIIPFSAVTIPFLMRKSRVMGQLVVLNWGSQIIFKSSDAVTSAKSSTSPSLFLGTKLAGSSRSNAYSVAGNRPRSDSKKKLEKK